MVQERDKTGFKEHDREIVKGIPERYKLMPLRFAKSQSSSPLLHPENYGTF